MKMVDFSFNNSRVKKQKNPLSYLSNWEILESFITLTEIRLNKTVIRR